MPLIIFSLMGAVWSPEDCKNCCPIEYRMCKDTDQTDLINNAGRKAPDRESFKPATVVKVFRINEKGSLQNKWEGNMEMCRLKQQPVKSVGATCRRC